MGLGTVRSFRHPLGVSEPIPRCVGMAEFVWVTQWWHCLPTRCWADASGVTFSDVAHVSVKEKAFELRVSLAFVLFVRMCQGK